MKSWVTGRGSRVDPRRPHSIADRRSVRGVVVRLLALVAWWIAIWSLTARPAHGQVAGTSRGEVARDSAAVAAHALPRGHVIAADDVAWIPADSLAKLGYRAAPTSHSASPIAGSTTRRAIAAGEPLRAPAVTAADAVAAGARVAVVYREAGIELRMQGTALNAAPLGGRAAVRVDARRRLTGTVAAPGVVKLD